ncbi:MAG: serpin family protein [Mycobacteriales bacterium]|nr:MAG: hypothetical protein DLM61_18045 [Pseudonocardiales bacterium]
MPSTTLDLRRCLQHYADAFHLAVGTGHHVCSPLGAWLVVALAAPAADDAEREQLAEVLGADVESAAQVAAELLSEPHPLVAAAAAAWRRADVDTHALKRWLAGLPTVVETGDLPDQAALDAWAARHTEGLIEEFPVEIDPDTVLVLASALATRISWGEPFEIAPAAELGADSEWTQRLRQVLRTPSDARHHQFIATTERAGDVAVHAAADTERRLWVASVIAAPDVAVADVLAAAERLAPDLLEYPQPGRISLFDLPLGDGPAWTMTERAASTTARSGREERYTSVLPAWSAQSKHDLTRSVELGFPAAAAALAKAMTLGRHRHVAKQAAMARYTRVGFEAAAVTAVVMERSAASAPRPGLRRDALLRFAHPYAVVAVTADEPGRRPTAVESRWHGLPVFSAWITEPDDASDGQS